MMKKKRDQTAIPIPIKIVGNFKGKIKYAQTDYPCLNRSPRCYSDLRKYEEMIKKVFQNIQHLSQSDIREFYI